MAGRAAVICSVALVALWGCSSEDEVGQGFCPAFETATQEVSPSEVGADGAISDLRTLGSEAPDSLATEIDKLAEYLESGAIDYEEDPSSVQIENFPEDVQTAIARITEFGEDQCQP